MLVEVVFCKDCKHRNSIHCPLLRENVIVYENEDYDLEFTDDTPDDGLGFCHCGEK